MEDVVGHVVRLGGDEKCIYIFSWKARRQKPLVRPRHRWEDNIKMCLKEIGYEGMDSSSGSRYEPVMGLNESLGFMKGGTFLD
jgi:hypothetical protein